MPQKIRKILVPIDFSPPSDEALAYAASLAAEFGASLHLLHVVEDRILYGAWPAEVYIGQLPGLRDDLIKDAEARVADGIKAAASRGVDAAGQVLVGLPFQTIIEAARGGDVDLIVLGTHGRTGFTHMLLGSVAERVVRHAPCPVLVVRDRKRTESGAAAPAAAAG